MFHVTPGNLIGLDVDVVWVSMLVGVLFLTCGLHKRLWHCVFLPCHGRWAGGVGVDNNVQCLLRSEVMLSRYAIGY